jgi:hypothetical protein
LSQNAMTPAPSVRSAPGSAQAIDQNVPDVAHRYRGWYPRWWFLSAIFCALLIGALKLVEYLACTPRSSILLCQIDTWNDWRQEIVVGTLWLIFLAGWLCAFIFGVGPIEITRQRSSITRMFRAISQVGTVSFLLLIYGAIAFVAIIISWLANHFNPTLFAFASIIIFTANCNFLYGRLPEERRSFIIGYGVLALFCLAVMFLVSKFQLTIFIAGLALIVTGLWSVIRAFVRGNAAQNNPAATPADPQAQLKTALDQSIAPAQVFRDLVHALPWFRNRAQASTTPVMPALQQANTQTGATTPTMILTQNTVPDASTNQRRISQQPTQPLDDV